MRIIILTLSELQTTSMLLHGKASSCFCWCDNRQKLCICRILPRVAQRTTARRSNLPWTLNWSCPKP